MNRILWISQLVLLSLMTFAVDLARAQEITHIRTLTPLQDATGAIGTYPSSAGVMIREVKSVTSNINTGSIVSQSTVEMTVKKFLESEKVTEMPTGNGWMRTVLDIAPDAKNLLKALKMVPIVGAVIGAGTAFADGDYVKVGLECGSAVCAPIDAVNTTVDVVVLTGLDEIFYDQVEIFAENLREVDQQWMELQILTNPYGIDYSLPLVKFDLLDFTKPETFSPFDDLIRRLGLDKPDPTLQNALDEINRFNQSNPPSVQ